MASSVSDGRLLLLLLMSDRRPMSWFGFKSGTFKIVDCSCEFPSAGRHLQQVGRCLDS